MIIFDIEASGLSIQSYPIEIAWQDSSDPDNFDSFLITPHNSWTYWDEYAESEIHHISREDLHKSGINLTDACSRLNKRLCQSTIYSDAIDYDKRWMLTLFEQAGVNPTFEFGSIYDVIDDSMLASYQTESESENITHRALDDVRQIIRLMKPHT